MMRITTKMLEQAAKSTFKQTRPQANMVKKLCVCACVALQCCERRDRLAVDLISKEVTLIKVLQPNIFEQEALHQVRAALSDRANWRLCESCVQVCKCFQHIIAHKVHFVYFVSWICDLQRVALQHIEF
jgi:hypothetical protein